MENESNARSKRLAMGASVLVRWAWVKLTDEEKEMRWFMRSVTCSGSELTACVEKERKKIHADSVRKGSE